MARKRMLSQSFFTSATMNDVSMQTMLTFAGIWCWADDDGRGEDDETLVKAAVWPRRKSVTDKKVRADMNELTSKEVLCRYTVNDIPIIHVVAWFEHQSISHATKSKLPPCQHHEPEKWSTFLMDDDPALHKFRNDSGEPPEWFASGSDTVQFRSVKVSQVQKGSAGTTRETARPSKSTSRTIGLANAI